MTYVSPVLCSAWSLHIFGSSRFVLLDYFTIISAKSSLKTSKISCILAVDFYSEQNNQSAITHSHRIVEA